MTITFPKLEKAGKKRPALWGIFVDGKNVGRIQGVRRVSSISGFRKVCWWAYREDHTGCLYPVFGDRDTLAQAKAEVKEKIDLFI